MDTLQSQGQSFASGMEPRTRPPGIAQDASRRARSRRPMSSATHTQRRPDTIEALARGLGWFSVALGVAELMAPRAVDRAIGAGLHPSITRLCGLRELAAGAGLLTQADPRPWLWSRVAGDAIDLALLGGAMADAYDDERARLIGAVLAVAGVTALDVYAARASGPAPRSAPGAMRRDGSIRVEHSLGVNRSVEDCYRIWRNFDNLPRFMDHVKSVTVQDERRSHWVARGPVGMDVEWDAEITRDEPNSLLSWRSVEGSDVRNSGAVRFMPAPAGRGAIISVTMQYDPPGGALGKAVATLFGEDPDMTVREDMRRFKALLEAGETPTTEGQPHGTRPVWYKAFGGAQR
jgi:uncharacterized membrane protein